MQATKLARGGRRVAAVLIGASVALAGCATGGSPAGSYDIPRGSESADLFDRWFSGGETPEVDARSAGDLKAGSDVERTFAGSEIAYWSGDVEGAFEGYLRMLEARPSHPLVRHAAARLYDLRDEVASYRERIRPILEEVAYSEVSPLARVYLSLCGQTVEFRRWNSSEEEAPFRADTLGLPTAWRTTPRISPWRTLDFDRSFDLEKRGRLRDEYLSPWFAEEREVNRERTRPYSSDGLSLSPSLGRDGIYYLETFATVEGGGTRNYWLYGNFPGAGRVWIDGERVLERPAGVYGTGKRLRRVELGPGTHRILVKLGYARGEAGWYDLALLADEGDALGGSGVVFSRRPPGGDESGTAELELGESQQLPSDLEPTLVAADGVEDASKTELYLTAVATYYNGQPEEFEASWEELTERAPDFAPAQALKAAQVRTRGALPSEERDARAISHLREARSLDGDSVAYALALGRKLRRRNGDSEEARRLLEWADDRAVDGSGNAARLRNREALEARAAYLEGRGWDERAERAWRRALEADPSNCQAARSLQELWSSRSHYPPLEEVTPEWERCPGLERSRIFARPDREEERLAYYRREAKRRPFRASTQIDYADELRAQGRDAASLEVLERARDRIPWSNSIWIELADRRFADEGRRAAIETLREAIEVNGTAPRLDRRIADLREEEPLERLVRDGRRAAMEHLERLANSEREHPAADSSDEAYYLVDYAARSYAENGASKTLTHTVVRVMTKGAIDRFGEQSVPGDSRLLRARTINRDGTVAVPERSAGKSTLSMPELDRGDFVELAYVQYEAPSYKANSHREGLPFYFRMSDLSSLHSEYAILGAEETSFIRQNEPPEAEPYSREGYEGVHFVREESSRPREEPYDPGAEEYLPWIRMYRSGFELEVFDVDRRYATDRVRSSLETSAELEARVEEWREGVEPGSAAEIRRLFYRVADWVKNPNSDNFSRDASHVLASRQGSPHLLLEAVYESAGIDSELYLVKSVYEHPDEFPVGEFDKYAYPLVRVERAGGEARWLNPSGPDAMFGAVSLPAIGEPAVCVSCEELVERRVPEEGFRRSDREVGIDAQLDGAGRLRGEAQITFHGVRAVSVRSSLRETPERSERRKFFDRVVNNLVPGSDLREFEVRRERETDRPLEVRIEFERSNFGRVSNDGVMRVQTPFFREPVASRYAEFQRRERPLMIPRQRETKYSLELELPESWTGALESRSGSWTLESTWGMFRRTVELEGDVLEVESALRLPIQRISTDRYGDFQEWAFDVERSSRLSLTLER